MKALNDLSRLSTGEHSIAEVAGMVASGNTMTSLAMAISNLWSAYKEFRAGTPTQEQADKVLDGILDLTLKIQEATK